MNAEQFIRDHDLLNRTDFTEKELKEIFEKAIDQFMETIKKAPYAVQINKAIKELTTIKDKTIEIAIQNGFHLQIEH